MLSIVFLHFFILIENLINIFPEHKGLPQDDYPICDSSLLGGVVLIYIKGVIGGLFS